MRMNWNPPIILIHQHHLNNKFFFVSIFFIITIFSCSIPQLQLPCAHVMSLDYKERCNFVHSHAGCRTNIHYIDYLEFIFCTVGGTNMHDYIGGFFIVCIICVYLFITLGTTADKLWVEWGKFSALTSEMVLSGFLTQEGCFWRLNVLMAVYMNDSVNQFLANLIFWLIHVKFGHSRKY